jgi:hypothetical protein
MRDASIYFGYDYDNSLASVGDGVGLEYNNWDADMVSVCRCEYPYFGPDCSLGKFIV